jgi:multiple sugar transport system permease protein
MPRHEAPTGMKRSQRFSAHLALLVLCVPFALPLVWMVSTSLKGDQQIYTTDQGRLPTFSVDKLLPNPIEWQNYPRAIESVPFLAYLRNTIYLCAATVVAAVLSSAVVAYGFARLQFPGRKLLFIVMIATMALPPQVTMIPVFIIFRTIGWYGTLLPLIAPMCCGVPFFIFLLTQFYRTIPNQLSEAARIDGAGEWTIFWRIVLPMSKPVLATCAIFQFIHAWNDFFGPLLYLNDPSRYTLAYGLQQFMSAFGGQWAELMAGATMFTVPVIIIFFLAQRVFIQGISTTGMKG